MTDTHMAGPCVHCVAPARELSASAASCDRCSSTCSSLTPSRACSSSTYDYITYITRNHHCSRSSDKHVWGKSTSFTDVYVTLEQA